MSEETHEGGAEAPAVDETKPKRTRVSNAGLQSQVTALTELVNNLAQVVQADIAQREQDMDELRAEVASAKKKAKKAKVGERPGDVVIRNLHNKVSVLKLGDKRDPYRIELQPHGYRGDTTAVPASLLNDRRYTANKGLLFEEITPEEEAAIVYGRPVNPVADQNVKVWHTDETVVARYGNELDRQGRMPRRPLGVQYPDGTEFPGADGEIQQAAEMAKYGDDPEAREFLLFKQWKAEQARLSAQGGVDLPHQVGAPVGAPQHSIRARLEQAYASGDLEAIQMAEKLAAMVKPDEDGHTVIPQGALDAPVVFRQHQNVPPVVPPRGALA